MLALLTTQPKFNADRKMVVPSHCKENRKENTCTCVLLYYHYLRLFLAHRTVRHNQNSEKIRQKRKEDLKCATRQSYKESSV